MSECSFQHFVYNMERNKYRSYLHQLLFCWSRIEATLHEKGSSMKPIEWQAIWNMASPLTTRLNCHLAGWDTWLIFMAVFVNTAQGAGLESLEKKNVQKSVVFACSDPCFVRIFQTTLRRASICCTMFYYAPQTVEFFVQKSSCKFLSIFRWLFDSGEMKFSKHKKHKQQVKLRDLPLNTKGYPGYMFDIGVSHIKWFKKC